MHLKDDLFHVSERETEADVADAVKQFNED